jgi:putative ABC transport system permease protein
MTDVMGLSVSEERIVGTLLTVFAAIALLLTAVGISGLIGYTARQRTREIGIRIALGARPGDVLRAVTRQGIRWVLTGLILGTGAALLSTRVLEGALYGISTHDPLNFAIVLGLLAAVAVVAIYLPVRHTTRVDPLIALRTE